MEIKFLLGGEKEFNKKNHKLCTKNSRNSILAKRKRMTTSPETAIILGTGLGQLATEITDSYEFSYKDIPNFPVSTVEGHAGKLIFGKLGGKDIMAMEGRFHYYEGYSMKELHSPSASCTNSVSRHSSCQTHQEA